MPIGDRLIHTLALVTPTDSGAEDEYGQPVAGDPVTVTLAGLVQPKTAREMALASEAGAQVADHVIFLARRDIDPGAWIRFDPDNGDRYEITGIRDFDFGRDPHLEIDARRLTGGDLTPEVIS